MLPWMDYPNYNKLLCELMDEQYCVLLQKHYEVSFSCFAFGRMVGVLHPLENKNDM